MDADAAVKRGVVAAGRASRTVCLHGPGALGESVVSTPCSTVGSRIGACASLHCAVVVMEAGQVVEQQQQQHGQEAQPPQLQHS